jgi:hypothetical protein
LAEAALRGRGAINANNRKELKEFFLETKGACGGPAKGLVPRHEGFPQVAVAVQEGREEKEGGRKGGRKNLHDKNEANKDAFYTKTEK